MELYLLGILVGKSFPLSNSEIIWDNIAKLGTNIKRNQATYKNGEQ